MAESRTNMVSLIDIGSWLGGKTANIVEMGDGFTELTEDCRTGRQPCANHGKGIRRTY